MEHRNDIIKLLDDLNPEVHAKLVLATLEEAGYDIVRKVAAQEAEHKPAPKMGYRLKVGV